MRQIGAADTLKDLRAENQAGPQGPSRAPFGLSCATHRTKAEDRQLLQLAARPWSGTVQMLNSPRMASTTRNALRGGSIRYRARLYRQGFPTHAANAAVATNWQGPGSTHPDARVERHEC